MTVPDTDAPTPRQLLRSTIIALLVAVAILVTVVLPAEYGRDITGIGRVLGLTEMGEIKMVLAEEAAANAEALASADSIVAASEASKSGTAAALAARTRADTNVLTLPAGKGVELKLSMSGDARADYSWTATGPVNFDMHGDSANAPSGWFVSYKKGTSVRTDAGELVAGFPGSHGWFWRNRGTAPVEIRLITAGEYREVTRP